MLPTTERASVLYVGNRKLGMTSNFVVSIIKSYRREIKGRGEEGEEERGGEGGRGERMERVWAEGTGMRMRG